MFFDLKPYIFFFIKEAKLGFFLITDAILAVNWLVAHAQFLITEILEILLLLNLSFIYIYVEGGYKRLKVLFAYLPCHFTNTFYK